MSPPPAPVPDGSASNIDSSSDGGLGTKCAHPTSERRARRQVSSRYIGGPESGAANPQGGWHEPVKGSAPLQGLKEVAEEPAALIEDLSLVIDGVEEEHEAPVGDESPR